MSKLVNLQLHSSVFVIISISVAKYIFMILVLSVFSIFKLCWCHFYFGFAHHYIFQKMNQCHTLD